MPPHSDYRIELSSGAAFDLEDISDYTERTWGERQADVYMDALYAAMEKIRRDPDIGKEKYGVSHLRCYSVGRHVIFYDVDDPVIIIIRILYDGMDFQKWLQKRPTVAE